MSDFTFNGMALTQVRPNIWELRTEAVHVMLELRQYFECMKYNATIYFLGWDVRFHDGLHDDGQECLSTVATQLSEFSRIIQKYGAVS